MKRFHTAENTKKFSNWIASFNVTSVVVSLDGDNADAMINSTDDDASCVGTTSSLPQNPRPSSMLRIPKSE